MSNWPQKRLNSLRSLISLFKCLVINWVSDMEAAAWSFGCIAERYLWQDVSSVKPSEWKLSIGLLDSNSEIQNQIICLKSTQWIRNSVYSMRLCLNRSSSSILIFFQSTITHVQKCLAWWQSLHIVPSGHHQLNSFIQTGNLTAGYIFQRQKIREILRCMTVISRWMLKDGQEKELKEWFAWIRCFPRGYVAQVNEMEKI